MKKELQLRGISRTPSDRMSADGGCAESLNVQIEENEVAPLIAPDNITYDYFIGGSFAGRLLYMHKGRTYNNIIYLDEANHTVMAIAKIVSEATSPMTLFTLKEGEDVLSVNSVGNTLIVSTNERLEYVLFKDGAYRDLGDHIPVPAVEFVSDRVEGAVLELADAKKPIASQINEIANTDHDWADFMTSGYLISEGYKVDDDSLNQIPQIIESAVWELVNAQIKRIKNAGCCCTPLFARYAVRLFDGSYIYQSVPIMLGTNAETFFSAEVIDQIRVHVVMNDIYRPFAFLRSFDAEGWEDVVESIDLFLSTDIHNPKMGADIISISSGEYPLAIGFSSDELTEEASIKEEVLSKRVFYKVASFSINDLSQLEAGYNLMSNKNFASQDYLATQPTLPDEYRSFHRKVADNIFKYNERMMMTGIEQEITSGYQFLNGAKIKPQDGDTHLYEFIFHLRDSSKDLRVNGRYVDGGFVFSTAQPNLEDIQRGEAEEGNDEEAVEDAESENESEDAGDGGGRQDDGGGSREDKNDYARSFAWIAYPDTRCYRVDVRLTIGEDVYMKTYPMEEHPGLNCAYAFIGFESEFGMVGEDLASWDDSEDRIYKESNVVWASEMGNPFYFPVTGRISFFSEVIALATATKALSEGQFGRYPLYVFTGDGIWSVPISSTGDFAASVPMSRDVALSADSVQAVEQAIVFVTAQGVMLLQGSSVTNLSSGMMGEHYKSGADVLALLRRSDLLKDYAGAYDDDTPFQDYVAGCRIAYDYTNSRLLFYRSDMDYQYVYRFGSQSWHKMSLIGQGMRVEGHLNSYPDCYLSVRMSGAASTCRLYDLSVEYEPSKNQTTLPGLVITRPFDLDAPDVRKAITDIRIRGYFNRRDVRYILVGSMDGRTWGVLPTLRGGSYKLFRLVLMIGLEPMERISWVDVTYETRLSNRLR